MVIMFYKTVNVNDGTFNNVQDGETWVEAWQGMDPEGCGTPVFPHDGSASATYTYDESAGTSSKVILERKDEKRQPCMILQATDGTEIARYYLPTQAILQVEENSQIAPGTIVAKLSREGQRTKDITGGLPRVTELFEARNPSNPAIVAEIDGVVSYGGIKRANREVIIESKDGETKRYLVPLSKHILVQDGDFVKAGYPLSDGAITPKDILAIKGPSAVQEYILNGIQEVYRLQGVKINDKHIEVIVRQMMQKVLIVHAGDTKFLENENVERWEFLEQNDWIYDKKVGEEFNFLS